MWIFYKDSNGHSAALNLETASRVEWSGEKTLRVIHPDGSVDLDEQQSCHLWQWLKKLPIPEGWKSRCEC